MRVLRLRQLVIPAAATVLLVVASGAVFSQDQEIVIIGDRLDRDRIEVESGTKVTWKNQDGERHRVRSREGPVAFDSGNLEFGESFSFTFEIDGSYPYLDHRNDDDPAYYGTIVVGGTLAASVALGERGTVSIVDRSFRPPGLNVAMGGTISWNNDDNEAHTVTATDGAFDSGIIGAGSAFSQTFDATGSFDYFCAIHPEMRGLITVSVVEPAASEAPAEAVPGTEPLVKISADVQAADDAGSVAVSIIDRAFRPVSVAVVVGDPVVWSNDDSEGHTVTATDGAFNSGVLTVGGDYAMTFDEVGTFDYFCAIHPEMNGTVIVSAPADG